MVAPSVDFRRIRSHRGSQNTGFEELTRQLVIAEPPASFTRIEHRGPGADGGVEILVWLADGACKGWQSKYFVDGFGTSQLGQLKDSFETALKTYPALSAYVVAIPRNLSGSGTSNDERARWEQFEKWAEEKCREAGRDVAIELWDESEFIAKLVRPTGIYPGLLIYWFDQSALGVDWFREKFEAVKADLGDRYSPGDHVDTHVQVQFHILCRNERFLEEIEKFKGRLAEALSAARKVGGDAVFSDEIRSLASGIAQTVDFLAGEVQSTPWIGAPRIDLTDFHRRLRELYDRAQGLRAWEGDDTTRDLYGKVGDLRRIEAALENILHGPFATRLLARPFLLLAGEAGSGKSHALAHALDTHLQSGAPGFMLLGQYFDRGDPWSQIAGKLGLGGRSQSEILGALQAAALASGRPCLIEIDAINEAEDPAIWRNHLAGLLTEIERFDRLTTVISCRTTYESYCLPPSHGLVRVVHRGFEGDAAEAAKQYLDKRGIDRPATPFVSPEFTNPLFLSTSCKALEAQGKTAFPLGLDGLSDIFRFYVDGVQQNLIRQRFDRFDPAQSVVWKALQGFAHELVLGGTDSLPREQARTLLERYLYPPPASEHRKTFLFKLEDEGLLRWKPGPRGGAAEITFTFQRFLDHFCASAVLDLASTPNELATALKVGGAFAHLGANRSRWRFAGIIEALMVQVPEKFGVELVLLEDTFASKVNLPVRSFVQSLKLRTMGATSTKTVELFERLFTNEQIGADEFFTTLLELSSHPGHVLNADYLHQYLAKIKMSDRDATWSAFLFGRFEDGGPVGVLIDWAASVDVARAEHERLRLVATALGWFLSTSDRRVRDQATKSLAALFFRAPTLIAPIITRFLAVDDSYIRERVLGAAYGAVLHLHDNPTISAAADATFEMVFAKAKVERHAVTREYARGIIEVAAARGALPKRIQLSRCRPPYNSGPIKAWPSIAAIKRLGDKRGAGSIVRSAVGYIGKRDHQPTMAGDFGRYSMGGVAHYFSAERRAKHPPHTIAQDKAAFWRDVNALGKRAQAAGASARRAKAASEKAEGVARWHGLLEIKKGTSGDPLPDVAKFAARFAREESTLKAQLSRALQKRYESQSPYSAHNDKSIEKFSLGLGQRWVAARAVALGWSKEKHEAAERNRVYGGRHEHAVERIGKKYQWIAYFELVGYLMDYHWYLNWGDAPPRVLNRLEQFDRHDIDPSFLLRSDADRERDPRVPPIALPDTDFRGTDGAADLAWISSTDDLPDVPSLVERTSLSGAKWWLVRAHKADTNLYEKLDANGPMRTGQSWVDLILLQRADAAKLYVKLRGRDVTGIDLLERDDSVDRLVGEHASDLVKGRAQRSLLNAEFEGIRLGRLTAGLNPDRGEYDKTESVGGFAAPATSVLTTLQLRPEGPRSPGFVTPNGTLAFLDTSVTGDSDGAVAISATLLSPLLESAGLVPIWILIMEKDGGLGRGRDSGWNPEADRHTIAGMWWQDKGRWHGGAWAGAVSWKQRDSGHVARIGDVSSQ
jgi:hypothetical protein